MSSCVIIKNRLLSTNCIAILKCQNPEAPNTHEVVEQQKFPSFAGGNTKWYFEGQFNASYSTKHSLSSNLDICLKELKTSVYIKIYAFLS
jgi:hypothetical protein